MKNNKNSDRKRRRCFCLVGKFFGNKNTKTTPKKVSKAQSRKRKQEKNRALLKKCFRLPENLFRQPERNKKRRLDAIGKMFVMLYKLKKLNKIKKKHIKQNTTNKATALFLFSTMLLTREKY